MTPERKGYDLIVSLGAACACSESLRKAHLQRYSYPFDWLYGGGLAARVAYLQNHFDGWMSLEDLEPLHQTNQDPKHLCDVYKNKRTGFVFNHDFSHGLPLEQAYPSVQAKYARRIERMYQQAARAKRILFVCVQVPNEPQVSDVVPVLSAAGSLRALFAHAQVDLLYIQNSHILSSAQEEVKTLTSGVDLVTLYYAATDKGSHWNVDLERLASFLGRYTLRLPFFVRQVRGVAWLAGRLVPSSSARKRIRAKYRF